MTLKWNWMLVMLAAVMAFGAFACGSDDDDDDDTGPDAVCGNGEVEGDEVCDDGDTDPCGACNADCSGEGLPADDPACDSGDGACESECEMVDETIGDFSCLDGNADPDPTGETVTLTGLVEDFQDGIPVGGALLEVVETGATTTTAANGTFTLEVPGNERINVKITTEGGWVETWQYDVLTEAEDFEDDFVVVSDTTMTLIPGLLGVPQLPGNGAIAGTLRDCTGEPAQNAFVRPAPCNGAVVKYFVGGFPNKDQCPSSDDGLYVVLNADPSANDAMLTLDYVGMLNGEETVINSKTVAVVPDGLGVLNIDPR